MTIGENVKRLRDIAGINQAELAKLLGIHEKSVSALERGVNKPSNSLVNKLSKAFGVTEQEMRFGPPDHNGFDRRHSQTVREFVSLLSSLSPAKQHILLGKVMEMKEQGLI